MKGSKSFLYQSIYIFVTYLNDVNVLLLSNKTIQALDDHSNPLGFGKRRLYFSRQVEAYEHEKFK